MPIREESFRIGCGRYLQGPGKLADCGAEVLRLGTAPLIVGGPTALTLTKEKIVASVSAVCKRYLVVEHTGSCNEERAAALATEATAGGLDVIVGVGGGVIMDFAKLIGDAAGLPVLNIPTSSATCAAYTPLSVRYTPDGRTVGSKHFGYEVGAVLVDTEILAQQPIRLLVAGIFDALAKFVEISQRFDDSMNEYPLGLDWAYVLARRSFTELSNKANACIADMQAGRLTDTIEQVIFASIAATGVISGIARGSNQCALAHKFYEATRAHFFQESRPYLHGEIVGVGLLLQNHFNGEPAHNSFLLSLMREHGLPCSLNGIGITPDTAVLETYYKVLKAGSAIDETKHEELKRLSAGLEYLFALS